MLTRLTAAQFLDKYPDTESKADTLLEDMACPECGQRHRFHITFTGVCEVTEDGSEDAGDHEWTNESTCRCGHCDASATVLDFTIDGLDAALAL